MAAGEGFEPSHTESESAVLPLHKPAILMRLVVHRSEQMLLYSRILFCQQVFEKFFIFLPTAPSGEYGLRFRSRRYYNDVIATKGTLPR